MSKITSYLKKSPTGRYSYRRRVPDDCRKALGKLEHKVSLKTKVHSVALSRAANVNAEFDKAITEARGATETLAASVNPLQRQQAIQAAIDFLKSQGIHPTQKPYFTASGETINDYLEATEAFESNYEDYKQESPSESATDKFDQATGCRAGEIAGLTIGEVKLSGNIPYLEIRHNHIRQVKNDASERDIPVVGSVLERLRGYGIQRNFNPCSYVGYWCSR